MGRTRCPEALLLPSSGRGPIHQLSMALDTKTAARPSTVLADRTSTGIVSPAFVLIWSGSVECCCSEVLEGKTLANSYRLFLDELCCYVYFRFLDDR